MASNINVVAVSGNLTRDPELRSTQSGTSVCKLGVAVNERRKQNDEWIEVPNFFNVTVWGAQGENVAKYLHKGSGVMISGRLRWSSWENKEGEKRSAVEIVAEQVQFMPKGSGGGGNQKPTEEDYADLPADTGGEQQSKASSGASDYSDIPF